MDLKEFGVALAKIGLPLLGAVLPVPGGAAIGAALASHIGAPSDKPEDILSTLTASADALQKAKEFELTHQETMVKLAASAVQGAVDATQKDVDSARNLAEVEIAHGGVVTSIMSSAVRPLWGLSTLALVLYAVYTHTTLDPLVGDIIKTVLEFYFGGKIVEAIVPHVSEALSRFAK